MFGKMSFWDKGIILATLSVALIKILLLHPTFSDENFYFNVAKNIAEGLTPYKDFFFAHPPLQVYTLALIYKVFGSSFFLGKLLSLFSSSASVLFLYFIIKQICKDESAFFSCLLFLFSPPFLAFSSISYGMWETMLFLLLSILLFLKKKIFFSAISFTIAIFFRYITIFYLPLLILVFWKNGKNSRFLLYLSFFTLFSFLVMLKLFGMNYVNQTFIYHISKISVQSPSQYLNMNIFFIFLAIISTFVGFLEKNKFMILLALSPFLLDIFLLFFLKTTFYHYFLLSLPFYLIAFSKVFDLRYVFLKFIAIALLAVCLFINLNTLDFYLNPAYSKNFYYLADFIKSNTEKNDTIFGEPVATNYVSFVTGRKISCNYFDSYVQHLIFEGAEKFVENLKKEKPKVIIEAEDYYTKIEKFKELVNENYFVFEKISGIPNYLIYKYKI